MNIVFGYITVPSEVEAKKVSQYLLEQKLVACVNFFPTKSSYWWQGEIKDDHEFLILCKTLPRKWNDVKNVVQQSHSYECACIAKFDVEVTPKYLEWMVKELTEIHGEE